MPPMECINRGTHHFPFILTLTIRQTTAAPYHSLHQCRSIHPSAVSACIHILTSTACSINYTAPQRIHLHLQGKFLHLLCRLSGVFCIARSRCKLILLISDGGSQLRAHPPNAQGWGIHPTRYPAESGWDQPRGHPFLSHAAYSQHAMPLPRWPVHPL